MKAPEHVATPTGARRSTCAGGARRQAGFSLLETVVAFAITAMALVALYQAAGGALQRVGESGAYTYALALAESLLSEHGEVPRGGLAASGETEDGFGWEIRSAQVEGVGESVLSPLPLYRVDVSVTWRSGFRDHRVDLVSIRPENPRL